MRKEIKSELRLYSYCIQGEAYANSVEALIIEVNKNVAKFIREIRENPNADFECSGNTAPDILEKFLNEYAER